MKLITIPWRPAGLATLALCVLFGSVLRSPAQTQAPALNREAVLGHLNVVITWYRDTGNKVQAVGLSSDALYEESTRNLAAQAVRLAFQAARAEAAATAGIQKNGDASHPSAKGGPQDFSQMAARVAAEVEETQTKLDEVNKQLAMARKGKKGDLLGQRETLQGELALDKAVQDAVQKMAEFAAESTDTASEGLEGSINQLARSVPEAFANKPVTQVPAKSSNTPTSGLIGQAMTLGARVRGMREIDQMIKETDRVRQDAESLRKPLRETLAGILQRGRDLANEPTASASTDNQDARREYQDLTERFKLLSSAALPLSQEILLLEQIRGNYIEWRRSIVRESADTLRSLLIRLIGIALALAMVAILSDVWRRLTFRYIHDLRRRRQFLLLRRFVMGFLVGIVLIMGFVSGISSLATFAGFVTAGIAVGLQALLLSVAAYFFVVGRYGIRVGDRISIAGVTGDVVDVGIVRLYLMELAGTSVDLYPTGRIVVFSNSVLFQAGTPLFKQIPGTEYSRHELAVPLAPGANYKLVQDKILGAVNAVYEQYRARIEGQLSGIERQMEIQLRSPAPEAKLQLSDTGAELVIRYAVDLRSVAEIDDRVTRAIMDLVNSDGELKNAMTGSPKIRAAIKG